MCIDGNLSLHNHIAAKCRTAMFNLFKIANIRTFLTTEACHTSCTCNGDLHLDYANAIMVGLPDKHIRKLKRVQNMVAKVVLKRNKYTSSKASLQSLHWLPIRCRIDFKIAVWCISVCMVRPGIPTKPFDYIYPKKRGPQVRSNHRLIGAKTGKKDFC